MRVSQAGSVRNVVRQHKAVQVREREQIRRQASQSGHVLLWRSQHSSAGARVTGRHGRAEPPHASVNKKAEELLPLAPIQRIEVKIHSRQAASYKANAPTHNGPPRTERHSHPPPRHKSQGGRGPALPRAAATTAAHKNPHTPPQHTYSTDHASQQLPAARTRRPPPAPAPAPGAVRPCPARSAAPPWRTPR